MSDWMIYHNPQCSKSRAALQFLKDRGVEPKVVEYLKQAPTEEEVRHLVQILEGSPSSLVRTNEELYKSSSFDLVSVDEIVRGLVQHPRLLERPIVVKDNRAVIARPTERIELLF